MPGGREGQCLPLSWSDVQFLIGPELTTRAGGFAGEVTQIQKVLIARRRFTDMQMVIHACARMCGDAHSHSEVDTNKY